jgi:hypothetical protein
MPPPDIDVPPGRARAARVSARPRLSSVARRMLCSAGIILPLLSTTLPMSACVLPVAPEFQDPPTSANSPPFFITTDPEIGFVVTKAKASFTVTVSDLNVEDDLSYRWIADYPPYTDNTRRLSDDGTISHSADGKTLQQDISVTPDCVSNMLAKTPRHQIMVIVADRKFEPLQATPTQPIDFARVPTGAGKVIATWTLELECK